MNFQVDLSLNTLVVSGAVALVGYGLRVVVLTLVAAIKGLTAKLVETIAKVEILDSKMSQLTHAVGDFQKSKTDINEYFNRLRKLEKEFYDSPRTDG